MWLCVMCCAGMYSALPFGFAQVLVEIPYGILQAILYGVITYALICFEWTAYKFWYYVLFTALTVLFFTYYGAQQCCSRTL